MRRVSALLLSRLGLAQEAAGARLHGSWRLVSFQMQVVGEDAPPRNVFGPQPFGRLVLTPERYMAAYLSRPDRKPPSNQAEAAALLSSMSAYTGRFRLEGPCCMDRPVGVRRRMAQGGPSMTPGARRAVQSQPGPPPPDPEAAAQGDELGRV
ncbi:MAG TPA: lipocalin-like domain-containing protein [Geminicoccaceae bacterium]|nr:lipocalin-like domain-containing protein [Geminicoccaceae bacterium]